MATKIKNYFKQVFIDLIESRQRHVNKMIKEYGFRGYWDL